MTGRTSNRTPVGGGILRTMFRTRYDADARIWSGPKYVPMYHPNVNAAQIVFDALARSSNLVGQISHHNGLYVRNGAMRLNSIRMAQNMKAIGVGSGDVVAIVAGNHHEVAAVVFGAMALAAPINTLDPNFKTGANLQLNGFYRNYHKISLSSIIPAEITHMLALTRPKIVFCEARNIGFVREALLELDLDSQLFTIGEKVDGAEIVDDLLRKTGTEDEFL